VYFDDTRVLNINKKILTPGEMESIKITPKLLDFKKPQKEITIRVEGM
jgi:hypothetical protein